MKLLRAGARQSEMVAAVSTSTDLRAVLLRVGEFEPVTLIQTRGDEWLAFAPDGGGRENRLAGNLLRLRRVAGAPPRIYGAAVVMSGAEKATLARSDDPAWARQKQTGQSGRFGTLPSAETEAEFFDEGDSSARSALHEWAVGLARRHVPQATFGFGLAMWANGFLSAVWQSLCGVAAWLEQTGVLLLAACGASFALGGWAWPHMRVLCVRWWPLRVVWGRPQHSSAAAHPRGCATVVARRYGVAPAASPAPPEAQDERKTPIRADTRTQIAPELPEIRQTGK